MGQRWSEEEEHGTCVSQFSNLLTLNGIIFQLAFCCRYSVNNMHANVLPTLSKWANNEDQHVCQAIIVVLRHQTTVVFWAKGKDTPPPPGALPKGASSGNHATSNLLRTGLHIFVTYLFATQPSLPTSLPYIALNIFGSYVRLNNISRTLFKLGPRPALPRARRGGGAPSAQFTGHLSTPYDREPHVFIKVVLSPLHPYPSK